MRYCRGAIIETFKIKDLSLPYLLLLYCIVRRTHQDLWWKKIINSSQNSHPVTDGQDHGKLFSCPADSLDPAKSTIYSTSSIPCHMFHTGWLEIEWFLLNEERKGERDEGGRRDVYVFIIFKEYLLGARHLLYIYIIFLILIIILLNKLHITILEMKSRK